MNLLKEAGRASCACVTTIGLLILHLYVFPTGAYAFQVNAAQSSGDPLVMPGVVVVQFTGHVEISSGASKTGSPTFDRIATKQNVRRIEKALPFLEAYSGKRAFTSRLEALNRVYYVYYDSEIAPEQMALLLARDPEVAFAEPRYMQRISNTGPAPNPNRLTPNDPLFSSMTHLPHLNVPEAWDVVRGEQGNVIIAIVDGGTDWRHPDLMPNVWTNPLEVDNDGIDNDGNGFVDDLHGWNFATATETSNGTPDPTGLPTLPRNARHGTLVAGTAAAATDNGQGVAGSSWNARFMAINAACPTIDDLICNSNSGIAYAAMNGADIINASFGGPGFSEFSNQVIQAAIDMGSLVVASSGNEGQNSDITPSYPAQYEGVLSVGGTQKSSDAVVFNYGKSVNVYAPAVNINTTSPDGQYLTPSGTSFSSPLVAGIAALVKTRNPGFSPDQVREQIRITADNIDTSNPQFNGQLGRGRVNAMRAVTETGSPAVRLTGWSYRDEDGNFDIRSGEIVEVTATFTNYLEDASNLTLALVSDDDFVAFPEGTANVGTLSSGDSVVVTFQFQMQADTPDNHPVLLFTRASDGSYSDEADVLRFTVNVTSVVNHNSGPLQVSLTDEGNIGYLVFQGNSPGGGFNFNGRDFLFEGGLILATGPDRVSDCVRGVNNDTDQDTDLSLKEGSSLEIFDNGGLTAEQGRVELVDLNAPSPIGIDILQESFVETGPAYEDFILLRYTLSNNTASRIESLYAGLFFDWDLAANAQEDYARFDDARLTGYVIDAANAPTALVGVRVVSDLPAGASLAYRAIDNPTEIYGNTADGGFTEQEKWAFLSDGIQTKSLSSTDVSQLVGAGPFRLDSGASVDVVFAIIAGETEPDLLQNADNAWALWNSLPVHIEDTSPVRPEGPTLHAVFPNPIDPPVKISYSLPEPAPVTVAIFDALGRRVRVFQEGVRPAGTHHIEWYGRNESGAALASGVYFVRLIGKGAASYTQSRAIVIQ